MVKEQFATLTMSNVAPKVLSNDDMPGGSMSSVKLLLDLCSNILLDVVFLEGSGRDVDALLLHVLAHVDVFDDGFGGGACEGGCSGSLCGGCGDVHFGWHKGS